MSGVRECEAGATSAKAMRTIGADTAAASRTRAAGINAVAHAAIDWHGDREEPDFGHGARLGDGT